MMIKKRETGKNTLEGIAGEERANAERIRHTAGR